MSDMGYLDVYVPSGGNTSRSVRTAWLGLNRENPQDAGVLSEASNISVRDLPYLRTAPLAEELASLPGRICGLYDVGDGAYVAAVRSENAGVHFTLYYVKGDVVATCDVSVGTGLLYPTNVVSFNVYTEKNGGEIVSSSYVRKILVFPQCLSFTPPTVSGAFQAESFNVPQNPVPQLPYTVVHMGRLWGVKDGKFYASGWNDYSDWSLPNADDLDGDVSQFPWVSATQSDVNASGNFTAIAVYDNHVIGFKKSYMHAIYNNKNPFRIVDVAKVGALSQEAVCECNQILFFVGEDGVYAFTGGYPERISDPLALTSFEGAKLGADSVTLYLSLPGDGIYTYDTVHHAWGHIDGPAFYEEIVQFATVEGRCLYAAIVVGASQVKALGTEDYNVDFSLKTDATLGGQLLEKRLKRIRLQVVHRNHADGDRLTLTVEKTPSGRLVVRKNLTPSSNGTFVISSLMRGTCDFGHAIRINGHGDFEIRYLQADYGAGGERYV